MANIKRLLLLMPLIFTPFHTMAEEVRVAVASNFLTPLHRLASSFEHQSGHKLVIISGSTGKLYAQIMHGAPFDVFLAADAHRPELLEKKGASVSQSRFTYAIGQLVFWAPASQQDHGNACRAILHKETIQRLAIANPMTAPYGKAAEAVLRHEKRWEALQSRIVQGENIAQTLQYIITKNADTGFVALSQIKDPLLKPSGCIWHIPNTYHQPLDQQAVLLKRGVNNQAAQAFLSFLHSSEAHGMIRRMGYDLPL